VIFFILETDLPSCDSNPSGPSVIPAAICYGEGDGQWELRS
jgi:hypothetical protein